jgi:hypothetical protein
MSSGIRLAFEGQQANRIEKQIDYVVGSGDHARTYLHRTGEGKLIELPVILVQRVGLVLGNESRVCARFRSESSPGSSEGSIPLSLRLDFFENGPKHCEKSSMGRSS